ncbi:mitochondrial carrier [Lentinula edodes]|uniref:Mitochondrial carrier n=1 Tax=Lentinula edodes TaxID=5353 RepID=A0A1Q3EJM8_LENED|nr:mitochondrial carrier [Lentinula edodes]
MEPLSFRLFKAYPIPNCFVHVRVLKDITFGSCLNILLTSQKYGYNLRCITGLYRGLPAPIAGAMVENASLFLSYRELQNLIRRVTHQPDSQKLPLHQLALAAAGSGAITSFLLTPIELVKCKMQVQMLCSRQHFAVPDSQACGWVTRARSLERPGARLRGLQPRTDTVKSAMQTAEELRPSSGALNQSYRYSPPSFFGTFAQMYKAQGIRGLYAGCGVTVASESYP